MIQVIDAQGRVKIGAGAGDMQMAQYDPDHDASVEHADAADTVPWSGVTNAPSTFPAATHGNERHSGDYLTASGVTFAVLNANGVVGAGASQVAAGTHDHTPKQTIVLGAGGWPATTAGCAALAKTELTTHKVDLQTFDFDKDTVEYAEFIGVLPDNYDGGTVTARFYWSHGAASSNFGVSWGLQGRAYADDDALDQAWGTAQYAHDTGGTASDLYISPETSAITLAGVPAGGQLVIFRVLRKADDGTHDTLAVDAKLLCVKIEYGVSALSA